RLRHLLFELDQRVQALLDVERDDARTDGDARTDALDARADLLTGAICARLGAVQALVELAQGTVGRTYLAREVALERQVDNEFRGLGEGHGLTPVDPLEVLGGLGEGGVLLPASGADVDPDRFLGEQLASGDPLAPGHAGGGALAVVAVDDRDRRFGLDGFVAEVEPLVRPRRELVCDAWTKGRITSSA